MTFNAEYDAVRGRIAEAKKIGGLCVLLDELMPWIKENALAIQDRWEADRSIKLQPKGD